MTPPALFRHVALVLLVALAGCGAREPVPLTPPADVRGAPVVRHPAEPALPPAASAPAAAPAPSAAGAPPTPAAGPLAGIVVPPEAIYVCVSERGGERTQTVIEFSPRVLTLCRRHPEMGPCQYERNVCRSSGGRVYAASGQEITLATEAEYDKRVRRVTLRAN